MTSSIAKWLAKSAQNAYEDKKWVSSVVNTLNTFQYDEMCRINSDNPPTIIGSWNHYPNPTFK